MTLNLHLPTQDRALRPNITVIGVGGAGGNAVNNMISANLEGVQFVVANTDAQALESALAERVIQLGRQITQGLGAGAAPEIGQAAAEEAAEDIANCIAGSHMVFITAGMGGGTGTGAAPVVARMAREQGILTVGVVTKPFQFEGGKRMRSAEAGLLELQKYVDTLIVIPNQNLFRVANERTTFADAFKMADEVLHSGVRGVTDLMVKPGLVNLDFADIRTVMQEMGKAMMGTGEASGEKRAIEAAEAAISNPLLDDVSLKGARAALINITGGMDMTLYEVDEAANRIREEIDGDANIIFGSTFNESMQGIIRVSVVATGIDAELQNDLGGNPTSIARPAIKPATPAQQNSFKPTSAYYVGRKPSSSSQPEAAVNNAPVAQNNNSFSNAAFRSEPKINSTPQLNTINQPKIGVRPASNNNNNLPQPKSATTASYDDALHFEQNNFVPQQAKTPLQRHTKANDEPQEMSNPMRILSRIAGGLGSQQQRHETEEAQHNVENEHFEEPQSSYDDYRKHEEDNQYDIPAFLRRKP
jgi:cell division protein FtsZ